MNNSLNLLYPEAILRLKTDLNRAVSDWDYLSGISGEGSIDEFEEKFISVAGGNFAIAMTNATSALFTALMAAGVGRGDEVILPSYTWPQTLTPVLIAGATPVFADLKKGAVTVDSQSVKKLVTRRTKAIVCAHLYGIPADVLALEEIAAEYKCSLIFDSAQGFGSYFDDKPIGEYGDFVAFSFGRSKLFSIGEGGALICKTQELYEKAIAFSQHPLRMHRDIDDIERRQEIDGISMNFRMHPLIASLAIGQLEGFMKSIKFNKLKNKFNEAYNVISNMGYKRLLPRISKGTSPSGVCLPLMVRDKKDANAIADIERATGMKVYEGGLNKPLHLMDSVKKRVFLWEEKNNATCYFSTMRKQSSCPNTEKLCGSKQLFLKIA